WVSLDAGDNDLVRFWRYIVAACQAFQGSLGQSALALLYSALHPPFEPLPLETALTLLLNEIAHMPQNGLLVLEDYHAITEPPLHETLAFFIDHPPTTLHPVLLTRSEPPLPLLRWRARGDLYELHAADLRFSPEETAAFLHHVLPTSPSDAALKKL